MGALASLASMAPATSKRTGRRAAREDRRAAAEEARAAKREAREAERKQRELDREVTKRLRSQETELTDAMREERRARSRARDVYGAIGFNRMFRDGTCEVERGLWSETLAFEDVSYQSEPDDAQKAVLSKMGALLDGFGPDSCVEYTVTNTPIPEDEIGGRRFFDPEACGENAGLAELYNRILNDKMREGSSNIVRGRYITYATAAAGPDDAERELARIRSGVRQSLSSVRSASRKLDGAERLALISSMTRPGKPFDFDYDRCLSLRSPLTAKDWVCPTTLDFRPAGGEGERFLSDGTWCQVLVMREDLRSELDDVVISSLLDLPIPMAVSWHLQPMDRSHSIALMRTQAAWIQKEIVDDQRRALSRGYDYTMLPPELEDVRTVNGEVLDMLQHQSQRLYLFTGLVFTYGATREELKDRSNRLKEEARRQGVELTPLALRQREGLNSVLPLAHNHVGVRRDLVTCEAAVFMPFTTQELDQPGGGYYGQNRQSGNLVICNRKSLVSPHGFICGISGSGKSFAVKREIENTILSTRDDEVYVMDVTGEYSELVRRNHGLELEFGPDSTTWANPLDMTGAPGMSRQAALAWKTDAVIAMTSALRIEGSQGLTQEERSVITAALERAYDAAAPGTPTLGDLVRELEACEEGRGREEALRLALVFGRYVSGPFSFLNHQGNARLGESRVTSFNTSDVPSDMLVFTMLANLEGVRNRMYANYGRGVSTWLYIDEVQSLFSHRAIIDYLARLWREGRKFGLICTGMTQSAAAMAGDESASAIVDQSGFLLLMRQSDPDREFWRRARGLSDPEVSFIDDTARPGQGLLVADAARVPITDDFPRGNDLYEMFSSSPNERNDGDD